MVLPGAALTPLHERQGELALDVVEIWPERRAKQTTHVLADNGLGLHLANRPEHVWEAVTLILVPFGDSAETERLTRWPARKDVHPSLEVLKVHLTNVTNQERWTLIQIWNWRKVAADLTRISSVLEGPTSPL